MGAGIFKEATIWVEGDGQKNDEDAFTMGAFLGASNAGALKEATAPVEGGGEKIRACMEKMMRMVPSWEQF